jgi:hypothetical protein
VRATCELRRAEAPGGRVYLYAAHRSWVGGRRRIVKHYLGVEERVRDHEAFAPKVWDKVDSMERRRTLRSTDVGLGGSLGGLREDKGHEGPMRGFIHALSPHDKGLIRSLSALYPGLFRLFP